MRNLSDSDGLSPHTSEALPDLPPSALPAPPRNIFSMLHLREVQAIKTRRQLQRHAAWLHRYELKSTLCGHQGCVNTIHWSKELTNTLVSGSDDMTLKLWRVPPSESEIKPMLSLSTCHRHNIFDAHLRGQQILSCGADGFVCRTYLDRFDAQRQERQGFESERLFRPNASNVPMAFKMDFLQSPAVFLVTFGDGYVRHFDLRCGTSSAAVNCDGVGLVGLGVEPCDGQLLALGGNDPFLRIYDLRRLSFHQESNLRNMITTAVVSLHSTTEMIRKQKKLISFSRFFSGHSDVCISGVCWDSCGRLLANYRGGDIELFDFRSAPEGDPEATPSLDLSDSSLPTSRVSLNSIRSYKGRINEQTCAKEVRFLCQGAAVASGGDCGHLYIWSTESTELLRKLPADRCVVNSVAPHPSLPLLATSGIEANIKAWDVDRSEDSEASQGGVVSEAQFAESRELEEEGHALMRQGAWVEATGCFEAALNRSSARSVLCERQRSCWMDMALCHLNLEEYQAAIQCCSRVLDGAPRGPTAAAALLRRAAALVALGRGAEAAADLAAAEEVEPENVEIPKLRSKLKKLKKRQSKESKESKSNAKSEG